MVYVGYVINITTSSIDMITYSIEVITSIGFEDITHIKMNAISRSINRINSLNVHCLLQHIFWPCVRHMFINTFLAASIIFTYWQHFKANIFEML